MSRVKRNLNDEPHMDITVARQKLAELSDLAETRALTDTERDELRSAEEYVRKAADSAAALAALIDKPGSTEPGSDPGPKSGDAPRARRTGGEARDTAMRHLDAAVGADAMPARAAEKIESMIDAGERSGNSLAARWAAAGSDPAYLSAFMKAISGERGTLLWTPAEQAAYARVERVRSEMRALGATGAGSAGAFQVPTIIDPAIRISSDGSLSPLRELAEVRQEIGHEFRPVTSAHVTNAWYAEHGTVADGSPTLESPSIVSHRASSFVPFSFEYESATYGGAMGDLTRLLADGYDQLTAAAFWSGNGTTQPEGLWTGIDGTASELAPAVAETFDVDADPYAVQNDLGPRFQPNAVWLANVATINALSAAETTNGAPRYPRVGDENPVLLRKRLYEHSEMPGSDDINAAATADNPVLVYGDLKRAYTIVDFAGSTVELVPHLFDAANGNMPSGQRGLLLWARVGAGVVMPGAVRVLNVATTA
ncbi:phage major capsid protein [Streptomyces sp. S1A]|uniref:phage major capsid protein n=1 Tax=Streptomyces sp. ICN903 TaxID=2964654 RepID=UPI001EDBBE20|nr:phage major capsid protein [Streptomyces sp. ICN903]MCG3042566.1 phage major capsid protein [Streptomyces sp. ICN903]